MDVVGPRPQNGPLLTSTNRSNMGAWNSLEAESLRPNSPFGERINDDDDRFQVSLGRLRFLLLCEF